jgi:hypothetical protein
MKLPSVEQEPEVTLCQWMFVDLPKTHHVIGRERLDDGWRISSEIVSSADGVVITRSGRRYVLAGMQLTCLPNFDAINLLCNFMKILGLTSTEKNAVLHSVGIVPLFDHDR